MERPVSRLTDELMDRQVNIQRGLQIVPYKIIDESDVHSGRYRGGPSMGRGEDLHPTSFLSRRDQTEPVDRSELRAVRFSH